MNASTPESRERVSELKNCCWACHGWGLEQTTTRKKKISTQYIWKIPIEILEQIVSETSRKSLLCVLYALDKICSISDSRIRFQKYILQYLTTAYNDSFMHMTTTTRLQISIFSVQTTCCRSEREKSDENLSLSEKNFDMTNILSRRWCCVYISSLFFSV